VPASFIVGLADAPAGNTTPPPVAATPPPVAATPPPVAATPPPATPTAPGAPATTTTQPAPGTVQQPPGQKQDGGLFGCGGGGLTGMMPFVLIFVVFYFMLIRPQQKKQREAQEWLKSLKKGDEVVTSGGLIGRISGLTDAVVTLELQEKVRVKVLRSSITGKPPAPGAPAESNAK
jgi:preprotein translocase subunit YajC